MDKYLDHLIDQTDRKFLDEMLFFHLSRRLNEPTYKELKNFDKETKNLFELLSQQSPISTFLKEYGIEFRKSDKGYLDVLDKGKVVNLDPLSDNSISYLKGRLGYEEVGIDNAVNGFAFNITKKNNSNDYLSDYYLNRLSSCPEFLSVLSSLLGRDQRIINDYKKKSTFYCYVYKVPLDNVIFDENDDYNNNQKIRFLFKNILSVIYHTIIYGEDNYTCNPIIRLEDNRNMPAKYFLHVFM